MDFKPEHGAIFGGSVSLSMILHRIFAYFDNKEITKMKEDITKCLTQHAECQATNEKDHDDFKEWMRSMQQRSDEQNQILVDQNNRIIHEIGELSGIIKGGAK